MHRTREPASDQLGRRAPLLARLGPATALALSGLLLWPATSRADEPFVGRATATSTPDPQGKDPKREDLVLLAARRAAFATALDSLGMSIDPALKKRAQDESDSWTRAYRVIRDSQAAGRRTVEVEVEIDLARLRKRVAATPVGGEGLRLKSVTGCGGTGGDSDAIFASANKALAFAGVLATDAPRAVSLTLECEAPASVEFTTQVMQTVRVEARVDDQVVARAQAHGFASTSMEAREQATMQALTSLSAALVPLAKQRFVLRIEHAKPAAKLRAIERALREAVVGVRYVALASIDPKGDAVEFELAMDGDVNQLRDAVAKLKEPTFALTGVSVSGERKVTASL